jgi:hypothetical protein
MALRELAGDNFNHILVAGFAAVTKRMCDAGSSASGLLPERETANAEILALLSYWKV